jgi:glycosyltransferase involved in cell wall biosynthesis
MAIVAARLLKNDGYLFRWFILGEGELKEKMQNQIEQMGLKDYVVLLGIKQNPYPYIKNANVIIQTSRNEGKSIVLDEAKILWRPIVSTMYDSATDQIINGNTGLLSDISSEGIYKAVRNLLDEFGDFIPQLFVGVTIIAFGIYLIRGKKKDLDQLERDQLLEDKGGIQ